MKFEELPGSNFAEKALSLELGIPVLRWCLLYEVKHNGAKRYKNPMFEEFVFSDGSIIRIAGSHHPTLEPGTTYYGSRLNYYAQEIDVLEGADF